MRHSGLLFALLLVSAACTAGASPTLPASGSPNVSMSPSEAPSGSSSVPSTAPPAGTLIAYVRVAGETPSIRTVQPDGSNDRGLAEGNDPTWSPDGRQLGYDCNFAEASARGNPSDICVMNADGSGQRVLIAGGLNPQWSPDGSRLLFDGSGIDTGDAWVANADGTGITHVADGGGSWSPDGEWLMVITGSGVPIVNIARADGSQLEELGECWEATWSPDSRRIGCVWDADLVVYDTATRTRTTLPVTGGVESIVWISPDVIALASDGVISLFELGSQAGDGVATLSGVIEFGDPHRAWSGSSALLSPDGQWLVFALVQGESSDVYVAALSGATVRLTTGGTSEQPSWQPSGD